ncbi:MAG: N-acetylmuramoyl-L-alanine amidase [Eubacteriales bacterium]|nr:N-acetylmuramoyl-L-alanine amidase [Eubacteriales bacterium]
MRDKFIRRNVILLLALISVLCLVLRFATDIKAVSTIGENNNVSEYTVIIDAGHGGEDCGAIGTNGVYEKDINFSVACNLRDMLTLAGVKVIMTRTEDKLLYTEAQNIKGQRKMYDLRNRLTVSNDNPDALFVSIHMNNFSSPSCHGLQVYYSKNTQGSKKLAEYIQNSVCENIQTDNKRKIKAASSDIYLLDRAKSDSVLVECGFLSNPDECEKLCDKDYQRKLSFSLFCGIIEFIENDGNQKTE